MERSVTLTLSLPLSVLERIDSAAKRNNTPRSHWLRDAALARLGAESATTPTAASQRERGQAEALRDAALDRAFAQLERERPPLPSPRPLTMQQAKPTRTRSSTKSWGVPMPSDDQVQQPKHPLSEDQRAAAYLLENFTDRASGDWLPHITANGHRLWAHTYAGLAPNDPERDITALARLAQHADSLPDTDEHRMLKLCVRLESTRLDMVGHAHWVDSCCPILTVGHKAAAAMICTSVPESFELRSPWPCLLIEVPDKLIEVIDPTTERPFWVRYCLVRWTQLHGEPRWTLSATGDGTIQHVGSRLVPTRRLLANTDRLTYVEDRELNALEHPLYTPDTAGDRELDPARRQHVDRRDRA